MKSRTLKIAAIVTVTLGFAGMAAARHHARGMFLGKRIGQALEKAGVDQPRIESILAQAKSHRSELISMWQDHKAAVNDIAELSAEKGAEVQNKVSALLQLTQKNREQLRGLVEELGKELSAREKATLVLNFADRLPKGDRECGSRLDRMLERLVDREIVTESESAALEAQADQILPELCGLRDSLKTEVQNLKQATANAKTSDAEIETILNRMKENRASAHKIRSQALQDAIAQLSPASQIEIAGKLVRLHQVADLLMSL